MSDRVELVSAHHERVTLRVADGYLKVDADDRRLDREVVALANTPVPAPAVRWRRPHVLALEVVRGQALGQLGAVSTASLDGRARLRSRRRRRRARAVRDTLRRVGPPGVARHP